MAPKSSTKLLQQLRQLMKNTAYVPHPVHAYIIPSGDAHQVGISCDLSMLVLRES